MTFFFLFFFFFLFSLSLFFFFFFFFFFCLIALVNTCNIVLNRSGKHRHSCLFPDLAGKALSLSPLSMMSAVGFSMWPLLYVTFSMWQYPSLPSLLSFFNHEKGVEFVEYFFCINWNDMSSFSYPSSFCHIGQLSHVGLPRINHTWS